VVLGEGSEFGGIAAQPVADRAGRVGAAELEDFNLDHLPSLRRDVLAHLATSTYVAKAENVILLGPPCGVS
jgi:hypothetical protein